MILAAIALTPLTLVLRYRPGHCAAAPTRRPALRA
jgi:hypothetical protein